MSARSFRFSIDRGGTFTDVFAEFDAGNGEIKQRVLKLLSVDPSNYPDAPREGIRRVLESETGVPHPRARLVDTSRITCIRMGTTVSAVGSSNAKCADFVFSAERILVIAAALHDGFILGASWLFLFKMRE